MYIDWTSLIRAGMDIVFTQKNGSVKMSLRPLAGPLDDRLVHLLIERGRAHPPEKKDIDIPRSAMYAFILHCYWRVFYNVGRASCDGGNVELHLIELMSLLVVGELERCSRPSSSGC